MSLRTLESAIQKNHWCGPNWRNRSPSSFAGKDFAKMKSRTFLASINPKCPSSSGAVFPDLPAIGFFGTSTRWDAMFIFKSKQLESFKDVAEL